jgi:hypothetical protein
MKLDPSPAEPDGSDEPHRRTRPPRHRVEQILVLVDEGLLFGVVEVARHPFRLAGVEAQTMQQSDQP